MSRKASVLASLITVSPLVLACGSNDTEDDTGNPNSGYNVNSGTVTVTGNANGGDQVITADQEAFIKDASCSSWNGTLEGGPSKLQLVVDVSNSMNQAPTGSNRTKWASTRDALIQAVPGDGTAAYPGLSATTAVGLLFYPNVNSIVTVNQQALSACLATDKLVAMSPLGAEGDANSQRALIRQSFQNAVLAQGTPTFDAYTYALESSTLSALAAALPGASFQLLITDGQPTIAQGCSNPAGSISEVDPQPIVNAIQAAWTDHQVKTFVIGSPGSENGRAWLSQAAVYGQTAPAGCNAAGPNYCHMDMTTAADFSAALRDGLAQVTAQIASCSYTLPVAPAGQTLDLSMVNVLANLSTGIRLLFQDTAGDCTVGWQFDASNNIKLCSETCAMVQADPIATVDVAVVCADTITTIIN